LISDENPLVGPPIVNAIVGAPMESTVSTCAQAMIDTPSNQLSTPTLATSFGNDHMWNVILKIFEKEGFPVEELCVEESGERVIFKFGLTKEAFYGYLILEERRNNIHLSTTDVPSINFDAFKCDGRNDGSAQRAQSRATQNIINMNENTGLECLQVLALHKALSHPRLRVVAKAVRFTVDLPLLTF
jgi:hypothetical protein